MRATAGRLVCRVIIEPGRTTPHRPRTGEACGARDADGPTGTWPGGSRSWDTEARADDERPADSRRRPLPPASRSLEIGTSSVLPGHRVEAKDSGAPEAVETARAQGGRWG